jgi:hypothetical protein
MSVSAAASLGLIVWSADRAAEVLAAYRDLTESAPRELTPAAIVRLAPPASFLPQQWHGKSIAGIQVCHSGADAAADLAAIRGLENPIVDLADPKPYTAVQSMLNVMEPKWRFSSRTSSGRTARTRETGASRHPDATTNTPGG